MLKNVNKERSANIRRMAAKILVFNRGSIKRQGRVKGHDNLIYYV
jgi:hypothetical protein